MSEVTLRIIARTYVVLHAIEQGLYEDNAASMAWKLHAIEQTQLRRQHRDDGVGRPKFDFHTVRNWMDTLHLRRHGRRRSR